MSVEQEVTKQKRSGFDELIGRGRSLCQFSTRFILRVATRKDLLLKLRFSIGGPSSQVNRERFLLLMFCLMSSSRLFVLAWRRHILYSEPLFPLYLKELYRSPKIIILLYRIKCREAIILPLFGHRPALAKKFAVRRKIEVGRWRINCLFSPSLHSFLSVSKRDHI